MRALDWIAAKLGYARPRRTHGFAAADHSRLTASLVSESQFINQTLRYQLRTLRARSRQAAQNNPYARRFVQLVVDNVCGPLPFQLQGKVRYKSGDFDQVANERIEAEWQAWGRKGGCEITGRWAWSAVQRLLIRILAVDGELLVRKLTGPEYGKHGFQLQIIDVDRLWEQKNATLPGGGAIHMGIEVDALSKPVAYHILKRKPSQWDFGIGHSMESERIPAEELEHIFIPDFAEQNRGVPWMFAALLNLVHLGAFEEAAVIAARVGAAQMGFIETPEGGGALADALTKDPASGSPTITAEPGAFQMLPPGYNLSGWNPKYPDEAMGPFIKACLRGVAAGLGVAYHNLANDLENVNYSSARIGELDERDAWMSLQAFIVEHLHEPLYREWLRMQVLLGRLPFPLDRLEKYQAVYFQPRRWAWVDPEKEVNASIKAIEARLKSRTRIIAEQGEDIEDTFDEIAAEEKMAEQKGVDLPEAPIAAAGKPGADMAQGAATDEPTPGADGGEAADGEQGSGADGMKARGRNKRSGRR